MTGATHMVAAATIFRYGKYKTPYLFLLAFLSHFLLDAVPHYELNLSWNYLLGAMALAFLILAARTRGDYKMVIAGLLGGLPDANWIFHASMLLSKLHNLLHFKQVYPVSRLYLFMEIVFALICIYLIQKEHRTSKGNL